MLNLASDPKEHFNLGLHCPYKERLQKHCDTDMKQLGAELYEAFISDINMV